MNDLNTKGALCNDRFLYSDFCDSWFPDYIWTYIADYG